MKRILAGVASLAMAAMVTITSVSAAPSFGNQSFARVWDRQDRAVAEQISNRSWTWGPAPISDVLREDYAEAPEGVTVFPLASDNECVQSIQAGREEFGVLLTSNTVVEAGIAGGAPIKKVGSPVYSENLAVAFDKKASKDPTRLVEEVGRIIAEMHEDGTLSELSNQWFETDLTQNPTGS